MPLSEAAKQHRKAQSKEYYKRTIERRRAVHNSYYAKNKVRILARNKLYRAENKDKQYTYPSLSRERRRVYEKRWKELNPEKVSRAIESCRLKKLYGISLAQYEKMFASHSGLCDACGCQPTGKRAKAKLQVDHCHGTGFIRGLLCGNCNTALGMLSDSPDKIVKLLLYVKKNNPDRKEAERLAKVDAELYEGDRRILRSLAHG